MNIHEKLLQIEGVKYIINIFENGINVVDVNGKIEFVSNEKINPICVKRLFKEKETLLREFRHFYYVPDKGIYCYSKNRDNIPTLKYLSKLMTGKDLF